MTGLPIVVILRIVTTLFLSLRILHSLLSLLPRHSQLQFLLNIPCCIAVMLIQFPMGLSIASTPP